MATIYKILGQIAAASAVAATETIYQAGTAQQAVISTVAVCNRGAASTTYRLAVRPDGTAVNNQHYIVYDATVPANDSVFLTIGLTLGSTDILACYAGNANLSFSAFGSEIDE